jgi:cytochrome c oxidase subunit 4
MSHHEEEHHPIGYGTFILVWLSLIGMTGLTVAVGGVNLGAWSFPIAMLIASIKCIAVILFFMHVKYEDPVFIVMILVCVMTLAVIIGITMTDTLKRSTPEAMEKAAIESSEQK